MKLSRLRLPFLGVILIICGYNYSTNIITASTPGSRKISYALTILGETTARYGNKIVNKALRDKNIFNLVVLIQTDELAHQYLNNKPNEIFK